MCAVRASITRRATTSGPGTILGRYRTPPVAIVCEICAISRGVAATRPCPMADDPISSGDVICRAGGSVLSRAPAKGTGSLKPKRSAMPTSLAAPTFTPSGAKTELHDCTNASSSVPPHDSPSAFCNVTPSRTVWVATGYWVDGLAACARSAVASVTSLNVEPGGWGDENAIPASARTSAVRGSSAMTPPVRPARALTAAPSIRRSMVVRIRCIISSSHHDDRSSSSARPAPVGDPSA